MYATPVRHTCQLCGKSYSRKYDLQRHRITVHTEDMEDPRKTENTDEEMTESSNQSESETDSSDAEVDNSTDDDSDPDSDLEENATFQLWYQESLDETKEMRDEKYQKYVDRGMEEEQAREKAYSKALWSIQRIFFGKYMVYLWNAFHLKDDETHQEIMDELEEKMDDGKNLYKMIKRVMTKYRHKFDGLFIYEESDDDEMDEESD